MTRLSLTFFVILYSLTISDGKCSCKEPWPNCKYSNAPGFVGYLCCMPGATPPANCISPYYKDSSCQDPVPTPPHHLLLLRK